MQRIQRKRTGGWRMPPNTTNVSRPSRWGNPHAVGKPCGICPDARTHTQVDAVIEFYMDMRAGRLPFTEEDVIQKLGGGDVACWCKQNEPCHADLYIDIWKKHQQALVCTAHGQSEIQFGYWCDDDNICRLHGCIADQECNCPKPEWKEG